MSNGSVFSLYQGPDREGPPGLFFPTWLVQLRDGNAEVGARLISFFGGQREGEETPEEAAARESGEELRCAAIVPEKGRFTLLSTIDHPTTTQPLSILKYRGLVAGPIEVLEGAGSCFYTLKDLLWFNEKMMLTPATEVVFLSMLSGPLQRTLM